MFSHGKWLCVPHFLDAQLKSWSLIFVPSNKRRSGGIPLCIPLCSTGLSGLENKGLQVLRWAFTRSRHSDSTSSFISYVCSEEHSSGHPVKNVMNSVLARHSSSTDEHQKQFQEEIKIYFCRSGERKDFFGVGVQPGSCGRRPMFSFLLSCRFSLWLLSLYFLEPPSPICCMEGSTSLPCRNVRPSMSEAERVVDNKIRYFQCYPCWQ